MPHIMWCFTALTEPVYVRAGLNPITQTYAITHELGHTHHAHDCSTQQAERKADK